MTHLTKVILDGPMGERFGREWELACESPNHALRLINANRKGVFIWIKQNLQKYEMYRVKVSYEDGREQHLDNDTYKLTQRATEIRFTPITQGAKQGVLQAVLGAVLIVAGVYFDQPWMVNMGASMLVGGIAQMLTPLPPKNNKADGARSHSYYFDGPTNTDQQGIPVQVIYGTCMVGSHAISAEIKVNQTSPGSASQLQADSITTNTSVIVGP